jgi:hypothetical protein
VLIGRWNWWPSRLCSVTPRDSFTTYKLLLKMEPWGISPDLTRGKP